MELLGIVRLNEKCKNIPIAFKISFLKMAVVENGIWALSFWSTGGAVYAGGNQTAPCAPAFKQSVDGINIPTARISRYLELSRKMATPKIFTVEHAHHNTYGKFREIQGRK